DVISLFIENITILKYNEKHNNRSFYKEISMSNLNIEHKKQLPSKDERHRLFGSVEPGPRTKPEKKEDMADLQNSKQDFLFEINAVGISEVKYPVVVESTLNPTTQTTVGTFKMTSSVDQMSKGTNMSRFLEQIEASNQAGFKVDFESLSHFTTALQKRLKYPNTSIEVEYPWLYERSGSKSGQTGLNHAIAKSEVNLVGDEIRYKAGLSATITTLCPCSKEISEYSAHSQRGKVSISVELNDLFDAGQVDWKKDLLEAVESNASAMIHPVLKRVDEKHVTEMAYENPRFVEDVVRLVAADLYELPYIEKFTVICENEESIHLHNAIAEISFDKSSQ